MFGIGGDPFQQQQGVDGGPLMNLQSDVASVLNGDGTGNRIYIPGGPDEPVFQLPNPARWGLYRAAPPAVPQPPMAPASPARAGRAGVALLLVLLVLLTVAVIVLAVGR
jgi:hypothetical protein